MAKQHNVKNHLSPLKWLVTLCVVIYILSLNLTNHNFMVSASFLINNSVYKVYNFFYLIPSNYKAYTANKALISSLTNTNKALLNQVANLNITQSQINHLVLENKELQNILHVANQSNYNMKNIITTLVFSKNLAPNAAYLVLQAGTARGIQNNNPVVFNNALIGRIFSADATTSKVMLITNSSSRIPVYTSTSNISAIVVGNNSLTPSLTTYEKNKQFVEGEKIFTSGLGGIFPRNIPVGTIHYNNNQWLVTIDSDLYNLNYVHIILQKKS